MNRFLAVFFLGCLAIPSNLNAQNAWDYVDRSKELNEKGEYDAAIAAADQAIGLAAPTDTQNISMAYNNRGNAWYHKGEFDKAIADFNQALAVNPNNALAYNNRGNAWKGKGEHDKAMMADYNEAIRLNPNYADAYCNRGNAWSDKGEYDKAIADFNQAIRFDPKCAFAYYNRGQVWEKKGKYDKAIADFNQALAVNPNYALAYNAAAWLRATCPDARYRDTKKAFENASKGYQLDGGKSRDSCEYIDTLAAAHAENGDFEKAKEWEEKAIELAKTEKDKAQLRSHLEVFKQKKPWREEPQKK